MSLFHDSALVGASGQGGGAGYQISRSLRFNSSDSAYLSRTPASAGNRKTWTWAGWVKRSGFAAFNSLFGSYDGSTGSTYFSLIFTTSDTLRVEDISTVYRETTQVFRDPSAWYHVVLAVDTTAGTASNRVRLYVNGVEVTAFNTSNNPTPSADLGVNGTYAHGIGRPGAQAAYYFNGYLADIHFIDGQALTPSSFTEVSATTGQLIPKAYTGTFTGNSFWLKFADNSAATATTLGKDSSGLGNNWTPNNLSVTAGAGNDSLVDTPTSYGTDTGAGGEVRGNYATLNPLANGASTLSNGNLDAATSTTINHVRGTIGVTSGKWYWECTVTLGQDLLIGYVNSAALLSEYPGNNVNGWSYYANNGSKYNNGGTSYGASYTTGDIIGIAFDADAGSLTFYKNGTSQGVAFTGLTSGPYFPAVGNGGNFNRTYSCNFGQRPFAYTAPSGFKALCDTNLPAPVVAKPASAFDVKLWNGNSGTQNITGLAFSPDLAWVKGRVGTLNHVLSDTIRGANLKLASNTTGAEAGTDNGTISAFNSDGISVAMGTGTYAGYETNLSGYSYVGWFWDAGSSTVTNTQGSITSQVRANASAGFSIVTYTGNGSTSQTVGHGLGVKPGLIIVKSRSNGTWNWGVYHQSLSGSTPLLTLNTTGAANNLYDAFNPANNSSTVFGIGNEVTTNQSGGTYVAYCFAPVAGYSSFGSYVGNGSADGPFVFCGFRPRWIMWKCTTAAYDWDVYDAVRDPYNAAAARLKPNSSDAEATLSPRTFDILSNGFKLREGYNSSNASSQTYIYAAFAESPFQYARAR